MENQTAEIIEFNEFQPEVIENDYEDVEEVESGIGTGLAMLIGSGLTVAGIAAFKFAKKKYLQFKIKKAQTSDGVTVCDSVEGDYENPEDFNEAESTEEDQ